MGLLLITNVYDIVENKLVFSNINGDDFIEFVNKIRIENKDYDFSILGVSDALDYIDNHCDNLQIKYN
jgi:hypothetical protein